MGGDKVLVLVVLVLVLVARGAPVFFSEKAQSRLRCSMTRKRNAMKQRRSPGMYRALPVKRIVRLPFDNAQHELQR